MRNISLIDLLIYLPLALLMQLPFFLLMAIPWLLLTWLLSYVTRGRLTAQWRFLLVSGVAAAGLSPVFGSHLSMFPLFLYLIDRKTLPLYAAVSFSVTWGIFLLVGFGVARYRAFRNRTRLKKDTEG
jgi:hypothetical protein